MWQALIVIGVLVLGACGETRRGTAGESCTKSDDCGDGLRCVSQVCVGPTASDDKSDAGAGSCATRRDCPEGEACVAGSCQLQTQTPDETGTSRYSGKGESCQAKNDCLPELTCVMGTCRELDITLPRVEKNCYRVECANKEDCCASFIPNANCPTYEMNCAMDPIFCNTYRSLCQCAMDCMEEQCVMAAPGCQRNAECTSAQTPFCVEGKCGQCDKDAACGGGAKCVKGTCIAACKRDENCPLLQACQDGQCVEAGCKSDRECAFVTDNQLAVCKDKECQVPCMSDAECAVGPETRSFQLCDNGQCVFVGCESDTECRALLKVENERGNVQAVCR